jgi:type III secretory pathway component EscV
MQMLLTVLADSTPEDSEVVAGPLGFALWIFMILAVVVLAFSLVKQLRKAQAAKDAGLYGDEPVDRSEEKAAKPEER